MTPPPLRETPDWLSIRDVAEKLSVSSWQVKKWIEAGQFDGVTRPSQKRCLIPAPSVVAFVTRHYATHPAGKVAGFEAGDIRQGVYFVQIGEFVKIGVARDVRIRWLSPTDTPHEPIRRGFTHVPGDYEAAKALERTLHRRFAPTRHRGEWFRIHDALEAHIQEHAEPWPTNE